MVEPGDHVRKPDQKEMKEAELDLSKLETIGKAYEPPKMVISFERDRPNVLPVVVASVGEREVYRDRLDIQSMTKRERAAAAIAKETGRQQDVVEAALIEASKSRKRTAHESEGHAKQDSREALLKEKDERVEQLLDETPEGIREEALNTLRARLSHTDPTHVAPWCHRREDALSAPLGRLLLFKA